MEVLPSPNGAATGVVDQLSSRVGATSALMPPSEPWRWVRRALLAAYFVATIAIVVTAGISFEREIVIGWVVGALLVGCVGRSWRDGAVVLASWTPFLGATVLYDFARGVSDNLGRPVAFRPQLEADKALFLGHLPTTVLQRHLFEASSVRWYDVLVSLIYVSHFCVPFLVAGFLWSRDIRAWRWYASTFVTTAFAACLTFAVFPAAPPWMAAREGLIPPFKRVIASRGWASLHVPQLGRFIDKGQATVNLVAAVPSLHGAYALIVAVFLWRFTPRAARPLLALYPILMCFSLTYAGEHYVSDVLLGWVYVGIALAVSRWLRRRFGWASPFVAGAERRGGAAPSRSGRFEAIEGTVERDGVELRVGADAEARE